MPVLIAILALLPAPALAHAGERALVLLLPTGVYIPAGVAAVALTAALVGLLPAGRRAAPDPPGGAAPWPVAGGLAALVLAALVATGFLGPRDPLTNLLPLTVWTGSWAGLPLLQAGLGDLWGRASPWGWAAGLRARPPLVLPERLGHLPALALFLGFAWFLLADAAPEDPARLARAVATYALASVVLVFLFGRAWLERGEPFTFWFGLLARLSPVARDGGAWRLALPGARLAAHPGLPVTGAVLLIAILAVASFDGLNETFVWLAFIGVNPLEFPGRSAVTTETTLGLAGAVLLLNGLVALAVLAGLRLSGARTAFAEAFGRFALSLVPIALGYHFAHYLTVLLINGQYLFAALSALAGLGEVEVTTSFFNTVASVRAIWLAQAGAIVLGHCLAIATAHRSAGALVGPGRPALPGEAPLTVLMVGYTWFGLFVIASPVAG